MKRKLKKLSLHSETLVHLDPNVLVQADGGISVTCPTLCTRRCTECTNDCSVCTVCP